MPSTYTVNLGIEKPATGEQSGTWGDTTNTNFDILDQAINGAVRVTLTSAGSSGSPNQLQITNGAASDGRNKWIEIYSASDLGGSAYLQLDPNDAEKILFIRNSLAGSQSILLFQGTYNSGRDLEVPAGVDMVVKFDGGGASAATVTDVYTKLRVTELTTPTLTATTADINGGTLDNSVIGGTTAAAITGTTITANTSLNIAGDGATVTGIKDEDDMSSNSPTKLATQQSIKAYVDSQVGTVDTWAEVLANGATSGSTNPEVTAGQALKTNTINETSAGSGVTIDSVLLKDDVVNATDIEVSSISANDGTEAATLANSTGVMTIASSVLTTTDINGGSIDGTNIGASTPGTGAFTTLSTTGLTSMGGDLTITDASPAITFSDTSVTNLEHKINSSSDNLTIRADVNDVDAGNRVEVFVTNQSSVRFNKGNTVFNEGGADVDFRIEGNSNANLFFTDANNDRIGVGTNTPDTLMHISELSAGASAQLLSLVNPSGTTSTATRLWMSGTNATTRGIYLEAEVQSTGNNHDLIFATSSSGSSPTERMRLDDQGRLGIATNPGVELDLKRVSNSYPFRIGSETGEGRGMVIADVADTPTKYNFFVGAQYNHDNTFEITPSTAVGGYTFSFSAISINSSGDVVVNENSQSRDFRVESNDDTHMLFVDGSANEIGIRQSSPASTLHVSGRIQTDQFQFSGGDGSATRLGRMFGWSQDNSSSSGATWRKVGVFTMPDASFSSIGILVKTFYPGSNYGAYNAAGQSYVNQCNVTRKTTSVEDTADIYGPYNPYIQLHRNSVGEWELQSRTVNDNQGVDIQVLVLTSAGGADFAATNGITAGTTGGTVISADGAAAYTQYITTLASYGGATFNEGSLDKDFRVESNGNANMLLVDGGNDAVGIGGTPNTSSQLTVDASADANVVVRADNSLTFVQDALWNSLILGGAYWNGQAKYGASNRSVTRLYLGHDGDSTPTSQGLQVHASQQGAANANVTFEHLFSTTRAGTVFNEDSNDRDFRIESNNQTHAFYLDAGNDKIGINKSSPSYRLDLYNPDASSTNFSAAFRAGGDNDDNRTTIFIGQGSNSRGLALRGGRATGDRAIAQHFLNRSGGTVGSNMILMTTYYEDNSAFYYTINEDSEDVDFRVESDSFSHLLHVGDNTVKINANANGATGGWTFYPTGSGSSPYVVQNKTNTGDTRAYAFQVNSSTKGSIDYDNNGTQFLTTSDRRLKMDIQPIADGTEKLMAMNPVTHKWIENPEKDAVHGFIAQEMQKIAPESISGEDGGEEMMSMDYGRITPILVAALQDAHNKIEALEARLATLEDK